MSNTEIRTLSNAELDLASGGITGGCIPSKTISTGTVMEPGQYQDPFVRYVIGRWTPVPY